MSSIPIRHSSRVSMAIHEQYYVSVMVVATVFLTVGVTWAIRSTDNCPKRGQDTMMALEDKIHDEVEHEEVTVQTAEKNIAENSKSKGVVAIPAAVHEPAPTTKLVHAEHLLVDEPEQEDEQHLSTDLSTVETRAPSDDRVNSEPRRVTTDYPNDQISFQEESHFEPMLSKNEPVLVKEQQDNGVQLQAPEEAPSPQKADSERVPKTPVRKGLLRLLKGVTKSRKKVKVELQPEKAEQLEHVR